MSRPGRSKERLKIVVSGRSQKTRSKDLEETGIPIENDMQEVISPVGGPMLVSVEGTVDVEVR